MSFTNLVGLILFVSHSFFTVAGLLFLKTSVGELERLSIAGLADILTLKFLLGLSFYVTAFILSLVILHKFPLGVSVSIMMPLSLVAATFIGYIFLNENISVQHIVGLFLILSGIFIISMKDI